MSIRLRIFLILFLFITVVAGLGAGSIYVSRRQVEYFEISRGFIQLRENLSVIKRLFLDQSQSFDYFIFLRQDSERIHFLEKRRELMEKLWEISDAGHYPDRMREINSLLQDFNRECDEALRLINRGERTRAVAFAEERVMPKALSIREFLRSAISEADYKVEYSRHRALAFQQRMGAYFVIVFSIVLILMVLMSYSLYRSISYPLRRFSEATVEIGKGSLDYRLKLKGRNEFRKIGDSFNRMLEDLREYQLKISQMGKMAAVGELSGGVAHEINNPLTGILGNAQRLLLKIPPEDPLYPIVQKMERAALRCRKIVAGLLEFSRGESYDFRTHYIHDILNETFLLTETELLLKNIKIKKVYDKTLPPVRASLRNLQQVFLNIIQNSVQAMPKGGMLRVRTGRTGKYGKDYVFVEVTDNGRGFDKDTALKIFEPFFTTKEVGEGTGLGLSISYRIIKDHNGFIELTSPGPGKGATALITLPVKGK